MGLHGWRRSRECISMHSCWMFTIVSGWVGGAKKGEGEAEFGWEGARKVGRKNEPILCMQGFFFVLPLYMYRRNIHFCCVCYCTGALSVETCCMLLLVFVP